MTVPPLKSEAKSTAPLPVQGIQDISDEAALDKIGELIDQANDLGSVDETPRALEWCDQIENRGSLSVSQAAQLEYFRANAWGNIQQQKHNNQAIAWEWEQPELQKQVFHLRRAINHPGFLEMNSVRRCQIFTNLANQLNTVGRFVDALEYWSRALSINPYFGMALGNRGSALKRYASALYDRGHQAIFLRFAHNDLIAALSPHAGYESLGYKKAKEFFETERLHIEKIVGIPYLSENIDLDSYSSGTSEHERQYRGWCLQNKLFLNPLNDLGNHSIAGQDVLTLPSFVTSIEEPPVFIGFFNQIKQEFVSARWLMYEGIHAEGSHFSDSGVKLYNTLDYPCYGLATEKIKAAYCVAYSIFDKIGFFLNEYMQLGINQNDVYCKKIWYKDWRAKPESRILRDQFTGSENWPLRGLFWLSKDLFEKNFHEVMEPDAQALYSIRNHMEHKYLRVHEMLGSPTTVAACSMSQWADGLAYSIRREDLEAKTLRLLRLSRAALIYLSLGMHSEERRRRKKEDGSIIAPMSLDEYRDEWKR